MKAISILILMLLLMGCATDYGKKPERIEGMPNVYKFTVYFSTPIDEKEIETYARNIASKLTQEKGCYSFDLNNLGNKLWGDRYYDYHATLHCEVSVTDENK
jgi:hypothetical protein